jgi:phage FluMu protein Com
LIKYNLTIPTVAFIYCKKCGELIYLTPHVFWNITDFGAKCEKCETINTITLKMGETNPIARWTLNLLHQMYYCIDLSYYLEKIMIRPECY